MITVNGWTLYAHPLFLEQLEKLTKTVEKAKKKKSEDYQKSANAKLLAAIRKLTLEDIPVDPARPEYRQGGTLGKTRKHWFRAKFASGRFRLFFRYSRSAKIIIHVWVNDRDTLRTYGSKSDAYAVFKSMLDKDDPPDDWDALIARSVNMQKQ